MKYFLKILMCIIVFFIAIVVSYYSIIDNSIDGSIPDIHREDNNGKIEDIDFQQKEMIKRLKDIERQIENVK